jgi:MFS family permease
VRRRGTLTWPIVLAASFGLFTFSLPVTLAAYARTVFAIGPSGYAVLNTAVALGSVTGALLSARRTARTRLRTLVAIGLILAGCELAAGAAPSAWLFLPLIAVLGASTLFFITTAQSMVQLGTDTGMRGRVLGVYLLAFIGAGALGGPLVGYLDSHIGPHAGLLIAGLASGLCTLAVAGRIATTDGLHLTIRRTVGHPRLWPVVAITR